MVVVPPCKLPLIHPSSGTALPLVLAFRLHLGRVESGLEGLLEECSAMSGVRSIKGTSAVRRSFLLGEFPLYAWGSLAERSLYEHVPFEPGVLFEDISPRRTLCRGYPRLSWSRRRCMATRSVWGRSATRPSPMSSCCETTLRRFGTLRAPSGSGARSSRLTRR